MFNTQNQLEDPRTAIVAEQIIWLNERVSDRLPGMRDGILLLNWATVMTFAVVCIDFCLNSSCTTAVQWAKAWRIQ
jgi:hypothetical protein